MSEQLYTFLLLLAIGGVLAFLFDCYRVTRNSLKLRWFATAIGDLLYWLVATVAVFLGLLAGNWGEIRFYAFLALFSGAGIYFRFVSMYAVSVLGKAARAVSRLYRFFGTVISLVLIRPVFTPLRWIWRLLRSSGQRTRQWFVSLKNGKPPEM